MVKYLKGQNTPTNDPEVYVNVESDCEDDPTETGDGTPKQEQEENRAVLIAGSFSAYARFRVILLRSEK